MNIFISANDNYIYAAKVMLTSFLINNRRESHTIYFMFSSVLNESIQDLELLVQNHGATFIPVQVVASDFNGFAATERFPVEVYYRFLISNIASPSDQRALWLDVDLVVNGPLDDFYYQDLNNSVFAACRDICDRTDHLNELCCPPGSVYINSGVILFNLTLMRKYHLQDFYNYYQGHKDAIVWPDQDILNGMFCGKIKILDCDKYNVQVSNWRFHNEYNLDKAIIIHYIGNSKPWFNTYTNFAAKKWDYYHSLTFQTGSVYLLSQQLHRFFEKKLYAPFRSFRSNLYARSTWIRKIRNLLRS